jgi:hypothetical protein
VSEEISEAPSEVIKLFHKALVFCEIAGVSEEAIKLQGRYIQEGIVSPQYYDDALHVAVATVSECDCIVSWNFKHIVNYHKIPQYNAVNVLNGYKNISIYSPLEVIYD